MASVYQGSIYYLEVFARKYEKEIVKLRQELEALQLETASRSSASGVSSPAQMATDAEESPMISTVSDGKDIPPMQLDDGDASAESGELIEFADADGEEGRLKGE
jgi:hypothetical protein